MTHETAVAVLDLFSGAGGLSAGLHESSARYSTVAAVEMDRSAAATFDANFGSGKTFAGSIQDWLQQGELPRNIDVVIGGPPCQGFSTLGKQDQFDERNSLWEHYAATIVWAQPKYFVVENVAAFSKSRQFEDFKEATSRGGLLEDYAFEFAVLNSADYGAAQARKRAVLIGHQRDLDFPGLPAPTHVQNHLDVRSAIGHLPSDTSSNELPLNRSIEIDGKSYPGFFEAHELHLGRNYTKLSLDRFSHIPAGGNRFDLPHELKARCWQDHTSGSGDVMGRLHWDRPSVTIRTEFFKPEKGRYLHPVADRAITHYEAALLQGFPSHYRFIGSKTSIARQIGNAVPLPLGAAIGRQLIDYL
jgi:DNA (cytosine-5)-methyltransferase 1